MKKQALAAQFLCRSGLRALLGRGLRWSGVLVLAYHRIGDGASSVFDRGLWSADEEAFSYQLRFIRAHLDVITPDDLPSAVASGKGRYGLITFDDGYRDNFEVAFPILKAERLPATFFVVTGFLDAAQVPWWDEIAWMARTSQRNRIDAPGYLSAPVWFDEPDREGAVWTLLRAYKAMPAEATGRYLDALAEATGSGRCDGDVGRRLWMNWDMVRAMRADGMTIGGHTVSHPVLARASRERQREEILNCGQRLAAETGEPMRYFSYPVGGLQAFDAVTRNCLQEADVRYAFSYYGGFRNFVEWDAYDIRRVRIETCVTADWFRSIVSLPRIFS